MNPDVRAYLHNGRIYDLHSTYPLDSIPLSEDACLSIVRHSFAHVTAKVLKDLFPSIAFGVGPATDLGFFYDVMCEVDQIHIPLIEEKIKELIQRDVKFHKKSVTREEAEILFSSDVLKKEVLHKVKEPITVYELDGFVDLCKGPHVLSTALLKDYHFKIHKIRRNEEGISRVEGLVSFNPLVDQKEEEKYLDHRDLVRNMDLASFFEEAPGFITWHQRGLHAMENMKTYIRKKIYSQGYEEIQTPPMMKKELWEKTGHLSKYSHNMFVLEEYALKPMNCPAHALYFSQKSISYKNLPIRFAEFGCCFRNESQGGVVGLKRVKQLTQDDAHIFCTVDHISNEINSLIQKAFSIYEHFGFKDVLIKLATRPDQFVGETDLWNQAERAIIAGLEGKKYLIEEGDGAFYGPKLDLYLLDKHSKYWQCGTIQVDFNLARRLDVTYINQNGNKEHPVVIHRALLGSLERFMAVLLEYHQKLPLSIDPWQFVILPISEKTHGYATKILETLKGEGFYGFVDVQNDTLSKKILHWNNKKIQNTIILGAKEEEENLVTVRNPNKTCGIQEFIQYMKELYER